MKSFPGTFSLNYLSALRSVARIALWKMKFPRSICLVCSIQNTSKKTTNESLLVVRDFLWSCKSTFLSHTRRASWGLAYWHNKKKTMFVNLAAISLLYFIPVEGDLLGIYCQISNSCSCDFNPNLKDLEWDLYKNVYGQHLVQDIVSEEMSKFLQNNSPDRPLVLSFHGSSGTGKTLVSSMLGEHLYGKAMGSPYVHQFVPTLHFPLKDHVQQYREDLKRWVEGNLTACARSIFIFDEMERMPPGVVDVLEPFLGPSHVVFQTNYRKAIYVFISITGEKVINRLAAEVRQAGKEREEIRARDLEDGISQAVFNSSGNGLYHSSIIEERLITRYVPFLPLSRLHVERCAQQELSRRGLGHRSDVVEAVGGAMQYSPQQARYFSTTGCKSVPAKISLFL